MLDAYRRTGADPPFGDPRGYHGVGMEGHFWRMTHPATGAVVVAILAISRDADGRPWAMASLATHPGGVVRSATLPSAQAAPRGLQLRAGNAFTADQHALRVDLGDDARLEATFSDALPWPRRRFGALGPAQVVPGLSQYWHPWLLRARVAGRARIGAREIDLDGAVAYAEKNWGRGGMPPAWWWGQAHGFDRPDACVAFAGGRAGLGPLRTTATALVVGLGREIQTVVRPLRPLRVAVDERGWRFAGGGVEVEAHADGVQPHLLPVPVPHERRRLDDWAPQHLTGTLRLHVHRRGRTVYEGTSHLAGLERGRGHLG
ncbi:MAG TPA: tocopherol cyclase family protein [Solirubrobacteraceae bacterium]|nr:tocopherol cyclase family protein [Solirubrobacteraceae bacterium]